MINLHRTRCSFPFTRSCSFEQSSMHILSMEHVVDIAPVLLVVVEIVLVEYVAGFPVTHDELHLNRFVRIGKI